MKTMLASANGKPQQLSLRASTLTRAGLVATFTCTKDHNLTTGEHVEVRGADKREFNVEAVVTVTGPTIFTYPIPADPGANAIVTNVEARKGINFKLSEPEPAVGVDPHSRGLQVAPTGAAGGKFGGTRFADTSAHTGNWGIIVSLDDLTAFSVLTGTLAGMTTGTVPKGVAIYGIFTAFTLSAGSVIAYNDREV